MNKDRELEEKKYPCVDCGKLRTKAEGGTTFTVCGECWDKSHKKPTSDVNKDRELKPCPFCGTEDINVVESYAIPKYSKKSLPDFVYVGCCGCGIGYQEETEQEAISAWNKRTYKPLEEIDKILLWLGFAKNRMEQAKVPDWRFNNIQGLQEGIKFLNEIEAIINARGE